MRSNMSRHSNDMRLSWLLQAALLSALYLVGTAEAVEGTPPPDEACWLKEFKKQCPGSQQAKAERRTLEGSSETTSVRRVCYFTLPYKFNLDNETAHLCTHIIAGFVKTLPNGTMRMVRKTDPKNYRALLDLRSCNPDLKVLVTTGINNYNDRNDSTMFSKMMNTTEGRSKFVKGSLTFLLTHGFDGLDLDWEYPGHYRNDPVKLKPPPEDKKNFVLLLKELQAAYRNKTHPNYCGDLLLSVPVAATKKYIKNGYDIQNISKYSDLVNVMCYNYHLFHKKKNYTRHNSPLFKNEEELKSPRLNNLTRSFFEIADVNWTINYLLELGLNKSKLNVGLPVFGRTFMLANKSDHDFLASASGHGPGRSNGMVPYIWVCKFVNQTNTTARYDNKTVAPYAYNDTVWVAYNEEKAITAKVNWTVSNGFGGVMTYALNFDDVNNTCGGGNYPIHTLIRHLLLNHTKHSRAE